jgi:hypothetical protein
MRILDPGSGIFLILDPEWKNLDPGTESESATLVLSSYLTMQL